MQELVQLEFFSRSFSMPCASFSMLDGPGGQNNDIEAKAIREKMNIKNSMLDYIRYKQLD